MRVSLSLEYLQEFQTNIVVTMTKVVLVATSATKLKDHDTGLWLEELASPYYLFKGAGYDVVISSPAGGPVPIDKGSMAEGFFTDDAKKFMVSLYRQCVDVNNLISYNIIYLF